MEIWFLTIKEGLIFPETFLGVKVDENNRNIEIGEQVKIKGWTGFNFPARQNKIFRF